MEELAKNLEKIDTELEMELIGREKEVLEALNDKLFNHDGWGGKK